MAGVIKAKKRWGYYEILLKGKGFWYKKLHFDDGKTSLQTHKLRDEIWVIYVPAGCKHRVGGKGDVLELALGDPKERDIKRYEK